VIVAGLIVGLAVAPAAEAKLVPRMNMQVAAPGMSVTVDFGSGTAHYLEEYYAPLEISLLPVRTALAITGRGDALRHDDLRLRHVGQLGRGGKPIVTSHLTFRVPRLAPGRYALAVFFRGTATGRWTNITAGWWGLPRFWRDLALQRGMVLRITQPDKPRLERR
jgi:hypothetical protein